MKISIHRTARFIGVIQKENGDCFLRAELDGAEIAFPISPESFIKIPMSLRTVKVTVEVETYPA